MSESEIEKLKRRIAVLEKQVGQKQRKREKDRAWVSQNVPFFVIITTILIIIFALVLYFII